MPCLSLSHSSSCSDAVIPMKCFIMEDGGRDITETDVCIYRGTHISIRQRGCWKPEERSLATLGTPTSDPNTHTHTHTNIMIILGLRYLFVFLMYIYIYICSHVTRPKKTLSKIMCE